MSSNIVRDQEHFSYPSCMKYLVGTFLIYWWPIVPFQVTRTLLQLRGEYIIYLFLLSSLTFFVFFFICYYFFQFFAQIFVSQFHRSYIMLFHRWKRSFFSFFFLFFFLLNVIVDQSVIYAIDRRIALENRHSRSYIAYWYTRTRRFKIGDSFTGGNSFPFLLVLVVGSCFRLPETSGIRFPVGFCSFEIWHPGSQVCTWITLTWSFL